MSGSQAQALRAAILTLLVAGGIVNFLDRSALSIANTTMRANLHLSATQIGALLSAFSLAYGFAQIPAGWLLDRVGPRSILSAGMLLWSVAQTATGLVSSFAALVATRIGLGIGEAPFLPGGVKVIRDWYDAPERGLPMGILNASTTLGQAFAPPLLTLLLLSYGWRSMFVWIGLLGVIVAIAWYPLYREPPENKAMQENISARHMEATLSSSHHVGHDARLQRSELHGVALSRMAARISRSRAPRQPGENRLARGDSLPDGLNRDARQRSHAPTGSCSAAPIRSAAASCSSLRAWSAPLPARFS